MHAFLLCLVAGGALLMTTIHSRRALTTELYRDSTQQAPRAQARSTGTQPTAVSEHLSSGDLRGLLRSLEHRLLSNARHVVPAASSSSVSSGSTQTRAYASASTADNVRFAALLPIAVHWPSYRSFR